MLACQPLGRRRGCSSICKHRTLPLPGAPCRLRVRNGSLLPCGRHLRPWACRTSSTTAGPPRPRLEGRPGWRCWAAWPAWANLLGEQGAPGAVGREVLATPAAVRSAKTRTARRRVACVRPASGRGIADPKGACPLYVHPTAAPAGGDAVVGKGPACPAMCPAWAAVRSMSGTTGSSSQGRLPPAVSGLKPGWLAWQGHGRAARLGAAARGACHLLYRG
jgi:hypothetical protein